jgi:hypothetical protein
MKLKDTLISSSPESSIHGLGKAYGERSFNSAPLPEFSFAMSEHEPVVDLLVGVPSAFRKNLVKQAMPIPEPVKLRALIDTGFSGGIMIDESSVKGFGLKPRNFCKIAFPSSPNRAYESFLWETDLSITFINPAQGGRNVRIDPIPATLVEFINAGKNVQALIGQEILQVCVFTYDGKRGIIKLTFQP